MSGNKGLEHKHRSRPLPHAVHTIGVEGGLAGASYGMKKAAKYLASRPYKTFPGTPWVIRPQPVRWGATRFLGRAGRLLHGKVLGIPVLGVLIDLFTPSNTIMSGAEEKRLLREARARLAARTPKVEQGIQYRDGTVHFPKSREWIFPPTEITRSKKSPRKTPRRKVQRSPGPTIGSFSQPALSQRTQQEIMKKGAYVPGVWRTEVTRSRPTSNTLRQIGRGL